MGRCNLEILVDASCYDYRSTISHLYHFRITYPIGSRNNNFVACLEDWDEKKYYDRFGDEVNTYNILDMEMPEYIIPVKPGRNLASVLEVAARNFRAKSMGYNALDELNNRLLTRK